MTIVLFNRRPAYDVEGEVKDSLVSTNGQVYGIANKEANEAKQLFEQSEKIGILNALRRGGCCSGKVYGFRSFESQRDYASQHNWRGGICRLKEDVDLNM
ncbi:MAG: hypothetical protein LUQ38_05430 [Methanotrichaceae archaeon]|nr:hypothetical protein [Methanotrichaceae archaeon]